MLKNLNELAIISKESYHNTFVNEDFKLNRDFKERLSEVLETKNITIQYFDYSAEISTSTNMKIFCPNQWFYLATFVVEYVSELIRYKNFLEDIAATEVDGMTRRQFMEKIKTLKERDDIDSFAPEIKEAIYNYFPEHVSNAEYLCRFITDYSWWHGSKTIDRGDYYISPTLNLLELVNVSQGYVAEIVNFLASDHLLMQSALNLQEQEFRRTNDSPSENLIVYGAPGTGKSRYLEDNFPDATRVVFHSEYSYYDFVGSYKPVPLYKETTVNLNRLNGESFNQGEPIIDYQFVPGPFIKVLVRAAREPDTKHTLLIEEINRANAPAVFGDIFQLLDRTLEGRSQYSVIPNEDINNYLMSLQGVGPLFNEGLYILDNMSIVATMNSADQGVYVLDSAFKRRWKFKYMPIKESGFVHENILVNYGGEAFKWRLILASINRKLKGLGTNEDRLIGPYFISPEEITDINNISSKLLIYLWDDVVRYKRDEFFDAAIGTFSELVAQFNTGADVMNIKADIIQLSEEEQVEQAHIEEVEPTDEDLREE
ncbi:MAG: AAA family ATPase [Melioribacteraceae bacterium]|nr:AAA family ATPase [Melioribacteraceae bacterium]